MSASLTTPRRILVATIVHHPEDARIASRQIKALEAAGLEVTYLAPFRGFGLQPQGPGQRDVTRARGRRRFAAVLDARRQIKALEDSVDAVIIHDPELLLAVRRVRRIPVVWDVHEDTASALSMRPWIPRLLRPVLAAIVSRIQLRAERRLHIMLAEDSYQGMFTRRHPVVPNSTDVPAHVPAPDGRRMVYVGSLTAARGVHEMLDVARMLDDVELELFGDADQEATAALRSPDCPTNVTWHGFVPNELALKAIEGSSVGLSLLHDEANYRYSRPTKIIEYLAHGVPVISTPLPLAAEIVTRSGGGVVVAFADSARTAKAVRELIDDDRRRASMATAGHTYAREHFDWAAEAQHFVTLLHDWMDRGE